MIDEPKEQLEERMRRLKIREADLEEKYVLGSGPGGQKIQKSSTCVHLRHIPSGIEIKCQHTRSRTQNRSYARMELCDRIEKQRQRKRAEAEKKRHATRQRNRKRSPGEKKQMVADKRRQSSKKSLRKPPGDDD
jgi:protein subunit release factor B